MPTTGCNWLDVLLLIASHLATALAARYGLKLPPLPFPQLPPAPTPPAQTPSVPAQEAPPEKPAEKVPETVTDVRRS